MTRYIGCETARELLDEFVDGELPMADQVMVEAHLRWCRTCSARVEDMSMIGAAVRIGSPVTRAAQVDDQTLATIQDDVLSRISAEHEQSLPVRLRELVADRHWLWPAVGACCAVLFCLAGASTVLYATSEEHPNSLAALISTISIQSAQDPLLLDNTVLRPRALDDGPMLSLTDDDVLVTLAAVVSSEGRISDFTLLQSEREIVPASHDRGRHQRELAQLLDQVKQSRFEPAQALTGRKVAVNMVWMIARTTVKGTVPQVDAVNAAPVRMPAPKHEAAKQPPPTPEPVEAGFDPNGVVLRLDGTLPTA